MHKVKSSKNNQLSRIIRLFIICLITILSIPSNTYAKEVEIIEGDDRILTSVAVSKRAFDEAHTAIIVSGYNSADALSSLSLSKEYSAPILLTRPENLPEEVVEELNRLGVVDIFIVGGDDVVFLSIEEMLKENYEVTRLSGDNRYNTNNVVNNYVFPDEDLGNNIYIANGYAYSDVLSIAPVAFAEHAPIILTDTHGRYLNIPYTNIKTSYLIGGESNLDFSLEEGLTNPVRIAGDNRFITSELIDNSFYEDSSQVFVTTGLDFADAITAIPLTKGEFPLRLAYENVSEINDSRDKFIIGGMVNDDVSTSSNAAIYLNPHQDDETLSMGTQLVRDINLGRDVYVLQFTRGERTVSIYRINARLVEEGYEKIEPLDVGQGRTNEMRAGLVELGVPYENIIEYPYLQYEASPEEIASEIKDFVSELPHKNIFFRVMFVNPDYDTSAGRLDHEVIEKGLDLFLLENKSSNMHTTRFLASSADELIQGYKRIYRTPKENTLWKVLYDNYGKWDPEEQRYAVGHYSVKRSFDKALATGVNHIKID